MSALLRDFSTCCHFMLQNLILVCFFLYDLEFGEGSASPLHRFFDQELLGIAYYTLVFVMLLKLETNVQNTILNYFVFAYRKTSKSCFFLKKQTNNDASIIPFFLQNDNACKVLQSHVLLLFPCAGEVMDQAHRLLKQYTGSVAHQIREKLQGTIQRPLNFLLVQFIFGRNMFIVLVCQHEFFHSQFFKNDIGWCQCAFWNIWPKLMDYCPSKVLPMC